MRRIVVGLGVGAAGCAVLAGCTTDGESSAVETVTQTVSVTTTTSSARSSAPASSSAFYPDYSASSGVSSVPVDLEAIRSIRIELDHGNKVGENLYQLSRRGSMYFPTINWYARGENGNIESDDCEVVVDIVGPGNFNERYRSGECSGFKNRIPYAEAAGEYTVKVSVKPPNGDEATVEATTIRVIPYGS